MGTARVDEEENRVSKGDPHGMDMAVKWNLLMMTQRRITMPTVAMMEDGSEEGQLASCVRPGRVGRIRAVGTYYQ
jgi:hypothetical protein